MRSTKPVALSPQEQQWLASLPVQRIGFDTNAAPYTFSDATGRPRGLSIDFARQLMARLGVQTEFVPYAGAQEGYELLRHQRIDLLAAVNPALANEEGVLEAARYDDVSLVGVTTDGRSVFRDKEHSVGQRILYDPQSVQRSQLAALFPQAVLIPASSTGEALQALRAGAGEAFIGDRPQTEQALRQVCTGGTRTLTPLGIRHAVSLGVAPPLRALAPLLNRAMASLSLAQQQTLRSRWLATTSPAQASLTAVVKRLWPALATIAVVVSVLLIAYQRLRREVDRRSVSERALALQLEFGQALLRTVPYPLVAKNNHNRLIAANPSYEALAGRPLAEMLGKTSTEIGAFNAGLDAHFEALSAQAIVDRRPRHAEYTYIDRDNQERSMLYWLTPFGEPLASDGEGGAVATVGRVDRGGVLATLVDITDVRRAEARVRESEQRLREITSNLPAVVYKLRRGSDGVLSFLYVGGNPLPLFGLTAEQMMAEEQAVFAVVSADDRAHVLDSLGVAAEAKAGFDVEFQVDFAGERRWIQSRASFSACADGDVEWDGYWIDTTEAHQQADALRAARLSAEAASAAKARFLATMSHEIRTPLAGMASLLELLAATQLDARQAMMIRTAQTTSSSLLQILGDALDFSRIEAGQLTINRAPLDLRQVVEEVCATLSTSIADRGLTFGVWIDPKLATTVLGDGQRIRQILLNLLGNAIRFTLRGSIRVSVRVTETSGDEQRVVISVADTGIGIERSQLTRVLEPFAQASPSTSIQFGGTGLGLSICNELTQMMDGRLELTSELAVGTTVHVLLPMQVVQLESVPVASLTGFRASVRTGKREIAEALIDILRRLGLEMVVGDTSADIAFVDTLDGAISSERQVVIVPHALPAGFGVPRPGGIGAAILSAAPLLAISVHAVCESVLRASLKESQPGKRPEECSSLPTTLPILIAEDQPASLIVIREQLRALGYPHVEVKDGASALEVLRRGEYAMLLTDCQMPTMDGPTLTRLWRQTELGRTEEQQGKRLPIVGLTANSLADDTLRCLSSGMDEILIKPVTLAQLEDVIKRHVRPPWLERCAREAKPDCAPRGSPSPGDLLAMLRKTYGGDETVIRLLDAASTTLAKLREAFQEEADAATVRHHLHDLIGLAHLVGYMPVVEAGEHWRTALRISPASASRPAQFNETLASLADLLREVLGHLRESALTPRGQQ
jgi:signal transduction histidine kinase/ABC-type amino acid transport substrate-binding protein/FixJ family two-component response regulator